MKPYYQDDAVTIYHGDCRELLPVLSFDAILTDPPYGVDHDTNYKRFTALNAGSNYRMQLSLRYSF